ARPGIVIHRTVARFRGIAVPALNCLAAGGSLVLNHPDAAFRSRDKLLTTLDLARAGIPVVPTMAFDEPDGGNLTALDPGWLVLKPARGIRGEGIRAFGSAAALASAWRARGGRPGAPGYHAEREHYLAQPLIGGGGQDIRAYVVADTCVALMRRVAPPGEIRANLAQGATGSPLPLDHPAGQIAAAALRACGLDFGRGGVGGGSRRGGRVREGGAGGGFGGAHRGARGRRDRGILRHAPAP